MAVNLPHWMWNDALVALAYGLQHSLLTTKCAVSAFQRVLPAYLWNGVYSVLSLVALVLGFRLWEPSGQTIFALVPGSLLFHLCSLGLALSLFLFFYCFKFTTSFGQWLGVKQIAVRLAGKEMPAYYKVRKNGIKRYIRFPHHTCLIFLFWLHPVMTQDTLLLAIAATVYLYLGTYHQDLRGLRLIGSEWAQYRVGTNLLLPSPRTIARMICDWRAGVPDAQTPAPFGAQQRRERDGVDTA